MAAASLLGKTLPGKTLLGKTVIGTTGEIVDVLLG